MAKFIPIKEVKESHHALVREHLYGLLQRKINEAVHSEQSQVSTVGLHIDQQTIDDLKTAGYTYYRNKQIIAWNGK